MNPRLMIAGAHAARAKLPTPHIKVSLVRRLSSPGTSGLAGRTIRLGITPRHIISCRVSQSGAAKFQKAMYMQTATLCGMQGFFQCGCPTHDILERFNETDKFGKVILLQILHIVGEQSSRCSEAKRLACDCRPLLGHRLCRLRRSSLWQCWDSRRNLQAMPLAMQETPWAMTPLDQVHPEKGKNMW